MESASPDHSPLVASTETKRAAALEHFRLIRPFLEDAVPLSRIAAEHRLSLRTLRRWVQEYRSQGLTGLIRVSGKIKQKDEKRHETSNLGYHPQSSVKV